MKISKNLEKSSKINLWINENLAFDEKILEVLHEEIKSNEIQEQDFYIKLKKG